MPSIRSVTMKPPTMLIAPNAIAMNPIPCSRAPSATPATIRPPSITIPWIAFVWLISGVCSVVGTFEITAKPTNAERTKITNSIAKSISSSRPAARSFLISPPWVRQAPATTSSSKFSARLPSSSTSRPSRFSMFFA